MAGMKKKATPRVGSSKADRAFAAKTGVGKTAQASRGMNQFASVNIPKGYTTERIVLSSGKVVALTGKTKKAAKPKPKPTPSTWAQRQKKAEADLLKKRKAESKRTGTWPNYGTN
jgi:hypothetical protein